VLVPIGFLLHRGILHRHPQYALAEACSIKVRLTGFNSTTAGELPPLLSILAKHFK
jgi:hypothetical protein